MTAINPQTPNNPTVNHLSIIALAIGRIMSTIAIAGRRLLSL
jgi:hypothetical protein